MRPGRNARALKFSTIAALALVALPALPALGQDQGFFSKLFGAGRGASNPTTVGRAVEDKGRAPFEAEAKAPDVIHDHDHHAPAIVAPEPSRDPGGSPRILPHPRRSQAVTGADPLVTRITLGRSDDGRSFGMFLQVFEDGTVIDSEGVHSVGREGVRAVAEVLRAGDLSRMGGHCGGPPTDFVEQVHVTVYDKGLGRLRANAFSFSGNPQGCDPAVLRLQNALDALQARMSSSEGPQGTSAPVTPIGAEPLAPSGALPPPIRLNEDVPGTSEPPAGIDGLGEIGSELDGLAPEGSEVEVGPANGYNR